MRHGANSREDKSIPIDPVGVLWVELHELVKENMGNWGHSHGGTRVTRVRIRDRISLSQKATYQHCRKKCHQEKKVGFRSVFFLVSLRNEHEAEEIKVGLELREVFATTYGQNTNSVNATIVELAVSHCGRFGYLRVSFKNGSAEVE